MEKINKTIKILFWLALGLSVGFPLGVLGIVFGAINGNVALLVFGIIFTVLGFYLMPILWVKYGDKRQDRTILLMIEREYIYTVSGLAQQTGFKPEDVLNRVKKLILTQCLVGYLFDGENLVRNENESQQKKPKAPAPKKCPNCGALMLVGEEKYRCEYCKHEETIEL